MVLSIPTLTTARLVLRPFTVADTGPMYAVLSDPRVTRYWDAPPWRERAQAERFVARSSQLAEDGAGVRLAIERRADGLFLGQVALFHWNPTHRSAKLGYSLGVAAWGQGHVTEAAVALLHWAFENHALNRVQAETDTRNAASARVLEKLGFQREGTLREDCIVEGEVSDTWVYGLLRRDVRFLA